MLAATFVETVTDLGLPAIVGAIVGAVIAHYSAKARGEEEHERTLDLLVTQDERRAAQGALATVRDMRNRVTVGDVSDYGQLHNEWSDQVLSASRLIRSDEFRRRARAGGYVLFLAFQARGEDYVTYAVTRAAMDVEEFLEAWLTREDPPPAHLPPMEEMRDLTRRGDFDGLNDRLGEAMARQEQQRPAE